MRKITREERVANLAWLIREIRKPNVPPWRIHDMLAQMRTEFVSRGFDFGMVRDALDLTGAPQIIPQTAPHALDLERTTDCEQDPQQGPDTP